MGVQATVYSYLMGVQATVYSYLMGVQAIYQNSFHEVLAKTNMFYCPRSTTEGNITLWSFQIPRRKLFDLLPALPLNNCFITKLYLFLDRLKKKLFVSIFKYCLTILINNTNYLFHNKHEILICVCF